MQFINEKSVLNYYFELLDQDKISFYVGKTKKKEEIKVELVKLRDQEDLHKRIQTAKKVWKMLFEASLTSIHPDKSGYDTLFNYFDVYVDFEELIFASDSFYRDHTLHCLWVYFLGEYIYYHEKFDFMTKDKNDIMDTLVNFTAFFKSKDFPPSTYEPLVSLMEQFPDEGVIRCLTSLTHDLGYPLKKIQKINNSIQKVLPYYGIDKYSEFDFQYHSAQMPFADELINTMSASLNFNPESSDPHADVRHIFGKYFETNDQGQGTDIKASAYKLPREEIVKDWEHLSWKLRIIKTMDTRMRYTHDFETYQHGIMSAYVLHRHLNVFKHIACNYDTDGQLLIHPESRRQYYVMFSIYQAIADHTSSGFKIRRLFDASSFLAFIDELEEFSRISRADQNRQFINEFCRTSLEVNDGCFEVNFVFDNKEIENLNPEMAFKGRCKKMLQLLDIPNMHKDFHLKLSCIGQLDYDDNTYTFEAKKSFAQITINGVEQDIPRYLKSNEFYTTEEYTQI